MASPLQVHHNAGIVEGMNVVDLCCGDGYVTRLMCKLTNPGHVYALILEKNLKESRKLSGLRYEFML